MASPKEEAIDIEAVVGVASTEREDQSLDPMKYSKSQERDDRVQNIKDVKFSVNYNEEEFVCPTLNNHDDGNVNKQPLDKYPQVLRSATKSPKETLKAVYAAGKYKAGLKLDVLATQSFMAGIYISSVSQLFLSVGGGILGSSLFPGGLMAVVFTSAELFTGDAFIFVASVLSGEVKVKSLLRNWFVSWCFNFIGSATWAYFLGYLSNSLEDLGVAELAIIVAEKKAHSSFVSIVTKGIGANFMVCIAIWQATCAEEVSGKVLALWFPITAFVAMGFDHCVANMYFIPLGMMLGADISVSRMFEAVLAATLGNAIGGGVFVGVIYWYVFDSMQRFNAFRTNIRQGMEHMSLSKRNLFRERSSFMSRNSAVYRR